MSLASGSVPGMDERGRRQPGHIGQEPSIVSAHTACLPACGYLAATLIRRGIPFVRQAALVTLGYPEVVIDLRKLRYRVRSAGLSQGLA